jgi:pimeloyl-ACP methyl ester carboxylesterase
MLLTERCVNLGDVELSIAEAGDGQRPLLLVHGFTGAKEDFTPWLDEVAGLGWHAVAPDLRGHGQSSKPSAESAYSFEVMADDVLRLADALGWNRFVLLGHSMGGMVAQFVARSAGERLAGLILMDTTHGALDNLDSDLIEAAVSIVRGQGIDALADVMATYEAPLTTAAHRRLLAERAGYAEFTDRKLRTASPAMYAAMAPVFPTAVDRLDGLRQLPANMPVLVMVGEQDQPFLAPSQRMAAAVPRGSLAVIPDAGHCPQFENTDAWWLALTEFLASLAGADVA